MKFDVYQDGIYVITIDSTSAESALERAKEYIAYGEWTTPGLVRVSISLAGVPDYIGDTYVQKMIDDL